MKKILALTILLVGFQAHAGFMAEPFIGYLSSSTSSTSVSGGSGSSTSTGAAYGARLGYKFMSPFWMAAEYTGGSGTNSDSGITSDFKSVTTSLVFGFNKGRYNLMASYGFSDKITYTYKGADFYVLGTDFRLGVGYEFMNHLALNVDVVFPTYTKYGNSSVSNGDLKTLYSKYTVSTAMVTLSFPFGNNAK